MSKPLYELAAAYRHFLELVYDSADESGVIPEEAMIVLQGAEGALLEKLAGCCQARAELVILRDGFEAEEKRIKARRQTLDKQIDWLEGYVAEAMQTAGNTPDSDPLNAGTFRLKIVRNPPKLDIFNADAVPHDYDEIPDRKICASAVKDAIKRGIAVPGAEIVQGTRLQIK